MSTTDQEVTPAADHAPGNGGVKPPPRSLKDAMNRVHVKAKTQRTTNLRIPAEIEIEGVEGNPELWGEFRALDDATEIGAIYETATKDAPTPGDQMLYIAAEGLARASIRCWVKLGDEEIDVGKVGLPLAAELNVTGVENDRQAVFEVWRSTRAVTESYAELEMFAMGESDFAEKMLRGNFRALGS